MKKLHFDFSEDAVSFSMIIKFQFRCLNQNWATKSEGAYLQQEKCLQRRVCQASMTGTGLGLHLQHHRFQAGKIVLQTTEFLLSMSGSAVGHKEDVL